MYSSGNLTLIFSCISFINSDLSIKFNDYRSLSYCQPNDSLLSLTDTSKDGGTRLVNFWLLNTLNKLIYCLPYCMSPINQPNADICSHSVQRNQPMIATCIIKYHDV